MPRKEKYPQIVVGKKNKGRSHIWLQDDDSFFPVCGLGDELYESEFDDPEFFTKTDKAPCMKCLSVVKRLGEIANK